MLTIPLHACVRPRSVRLSAAAAHVCAAFGVGPACRQAGPGEGRSSKGRTPTADPKSETRSRPPHVLWAGETVTLAPGRIILFTGRSGCGKSTALGLIERAVRSGKFGVRSAGSRAIEVVRADAARLPVRRALLDAVAAAVPVRGGRSAGEARSQVYAAATAALARAGLADARLWAAPTAALSDGQRFRAALAVAYARAGGAGPVTNAVRGPARSRRGAPRQTAGPKPEAPLRLLLIDEFCSGLDGPTAETVAVNLRRAVDELGFCAAVATARDEPAGPLRPDEWLHRADGRTVQRRTARPVWSLGLRVSAWARNEELGTRTPPSRPAVIEIPPRAADEFLRTRHYKTGAVRGVVRAFGLYAGERLIGAATLAHPSGSLQAHLACGGDFVRTGSAIARRIRATLMINRVALDEAARGRGLGTLLTAAVLERCGAEVVLVCAAMARRHPLFERAGMRPAGCTADGKPMLVWYRSWAGMKNEG